MTNHFDSHGGDQNIAQGEHAIGKQENLTQELRGDGNISSVTGNVTVNQGISPEVFAEYVAKYSKVIGETEQIIKGFLNTLLEHEVPRDQWDSKLRDIAARYKELLARLETVQSEDPQVVRLKGEARQAIELGDYAKAEEMLKQAEARDMQAIEELEQAVRQRRISAAETNADLARLQEVQLRYAKAADYWQKGQKSAALLPEGDRVNYLGNADHDLHRIAKYKEALPLYEQSLAIRQDIGDRAKEGTTLNSISQIYDARCDYDQSLHYIEHAIQREIGDIAGEGTRLNKICRICKARDDYAAALKYMKQCLETSKEIGDRRGEAVTSWNIGRAYKKRGDLVKAAQNMILGEEMMERIGFFTLEESCELKEFRAKIDDYDTQGDYATALKYLKQSLAIRREIGDKAEEGTTLNNISQIYKARGDYATALKYLKQSLSISREIGDKAGEGTTLNNIGQIYKARGDYAAALKYLEQSLRISWEIGDKRGEAEISWNIGWPYISNAVWCAKEIDHPKLEKWRKALERVRAKLNAQQ